MLTGDSGSGKSSLTTILTVNGYSFVSDDFTPILSNASIKDFVSSLHPTPAVCGLPMKAAKDFIIKNEGYNREFYTGFLGALNFENEKTELFVNLRCMQYVENKKLALYVGGGITKDSNATLEWDETENKTKTMLDVLTK